MEAAIVVVVGNEGSEERNMFDDVESGEEF